MVHPGALDSVKSKISDIINNCMIKDGWPVFNSIYDSIEKLSKEVFKHYGTWLKNSSLYDLIYDCINESLNKKYPTRPATVNYLRAITMPDEVDDRYKIEGSLKEIVGQEEAINLSDTILAMVTSIPKQYSLYFPLPSILNLNAKHVLLSDDISFLKFEKTDTLPAGKERTNIDQLMGIKTRVETKFIYDRSYIVIKANGYIHAYNDEITFEESLSKFKQFMQMGIILKVFNKPFTTTRRSSYMPQDGLNTIIIDMENQTEIAATIGLPDNVVPFANNVTLSSETKKQLQGLDDESAICKYFIEKLAIPIKLISAPDNDTDAKSIKTAVEWAFDSSGEANETISFIQACIGIEAILGGKRGQESLTETLADRCAYLLATKINDRDKIRTYFKEFYNLRSKIVHGRAMTLSEEESQYLYWGKSILDRVIGKEMNLWK